MTFRIASVFSDNCVLQRNKNIDIFGSCDEKVSVRVRLLKDGKILAENFSCVGDAGYERIVAPGVTHMGWQVTLPPQAAANDCILEVTAFELAEAAAGTAQGAKAGSGSAEADFCSGGLHLGADDAAGFGSEGTVLFEKTFTGVAIGEVWLCGGQSNMEFELRNATEGPAALSDKKDPNVRFYYTNKLSWMDENFFRAEENTCWQTWESEGKGAWSAVGFFFAKKLAADLGVTVGLLGCNWGGTSCSAWMDEKYLSVDSELQSYIQEQIDATKGKTIEEQCREYDEYLVRDAEWNRKSAEIYAKQPDIEWAEVNRILGQNEWPGPRSCKNPYRPSGLYHTMLRRVMPYTLKGVLWYQGESDDHKPNMYAKLFSRMIDNWRTDWNDDTLPFLFVQLPVNRYKADKDFKHWCLIREAQEKVSKTTANVHMIVSMDQGVYNDIHPKAKEIVGKRLEKLALKTQYSFDLKNEEAFAPSLESYISCGGRMILTFQNADGGFVLKDDSEKLEQLKLLEQIQGNTTIPATTENGWTGFEICGADGLFYAADPVFDGNRIILSAREVAYPTAARYMWFNFCPAVVFNKAGLPLGTFRTNKNQTLHTDHAAIQQKMTVAE